MPHLARAQERFITIQGAWRKFEIITQLKFAKPDQSAQAWIPVPSVNQDDWSKALGSDWKTNAKTARLEEGETGADLVYLEWDESEAEAIAEISSHSETRDRLIDFTRPVAATPLTDEEQRLYTTPTSVLPQTDRLRKMAATAVENAETDLGKAKAIYEWIAREQTCDTSDLKTLLGGAETSGAIPQDCDYLNRLFVGLAQVSGLPAREIYGIRVAPSEYGFESLGAQPEDVTARLHNRSEVWLASYGWVPVDPADLLRLVRYEPPGNLELTAPVAVSARVTLFGAWEGNWVAYNMAHDITLPESGGVTQPIFVRPVVRIGAAAPMQAKAPEITYKLIANELPAGP
jgi:transglutaminase-like putative cysteine protease